MRLNPQLVAVLRVLLVAVCFSLSVVIFVVWVSA